MAENVENIEARLCAYVDDELDAAEREEIERHLADNPAHGALLQDMIRHRARLQQLPREAAPRDLMEGFQSQLERESLIGGEGLKLLNYRSRFNNWPQILSAAAIVLLAVGLGVIVYSFLPHGTPLALTQPAEPYIRQREPLMARRSVADGAGEAKGEIAEATLKVAEGMLVEQEKADTVSLNLAVDSTLVALGLRRDPAENGTLMITVTADDLKSANNEVVKFLATNNIEWSEAKEQVAFGRELASYAYADQSQISHMYSLAPRPAAATEGSGVEKTSRLAVGKVLSEKVDAAKASNEPAPKKAESAPLEKPQVALRSFDEKEKREQLSAAAAPQGVASKDAALAKQSSANALSDKMEPGGLGGGGRARSTVFNRQDVPNTDGEVNSTRVILARNVNSRQAAELTGSLSQLSEQRVRADVQNVRAERATTYRGANALGAESGYAQRAELWYVKNGSVAAEGAQQGRAKQYARWLTNESDRANLAQTSANEGLLLNRKNAGLTQTEPDATAQNVIVAGPQLQQVLNEASLTYFGASADNYVLRDQLAKSVIPADERAFNCVIILQNSPTVANTALPATKPATKDAPADQPLQKAINR